MKNKQGIKKMCGDCRGLSGLFEDDYCVAYGKKVCSKITVTQLLLVVNKIPNTKNNPVRLLKISLCLKANTDTIFKSVNF